MKTHPFLLGSHSLSLTTCRVFNQWYLTPSLEIDNQIPLGGSVTATRVIVSFLLWRCVVEITASASSPHHSLNDLDFQEFATWLRGINSPVSVDKLDKARFFTLLGTNPPLERLVLSRGLKPYYIKILILKTFAEVV